MNPNFSWPDLQGPPPQYTLHNHFLAIPKHHSPELEIHFISGASSSNSSPPYRHVPACGPFHHEISPHEDTKGEETKSTVDSSQWSSTHVQPHNQISSRRALQETRDFNRWREVHLCQPTDSTVVNTSGNIQTPSLQASAQLLQVGQPRCRTPRLSTALPTDQCLPPQRETNLSIAPPFFPPLVWVLDAQHGSKPSTVLSAQALPPSRKSMIPSQRLHKRKKDILEKRDRHGHEKSATEIVLSTSQSVKKWRQQRTFSYWLPNELSELERYCAQRPGCSMRGLARGIHLSLGRTFSSVESKIKQMRKGK